MKNATLDQTVTFDQEQALAKKFVSATLAKSKTASSWTARMLGTCLMLATAFLAKNATWAQAL